jgi:hypothetical protein
LLDRVAIASKQLAFGQTNLILAARLLVIVMYLQYSHSRRTVQSC